MLHPTALVVSLGLPPSTPLPLLGQVVPPEKAVAKLKEHWGSILTSQLQQPPASNDIDHAIRALEHHKNQTSR